MAVAITSAYYAKLERLMQKRAAHLVLEDGTVFPGVSVGAAGVAAGRGVLHDGDDRLRGGGHRPELRRAGALLRLSADRHLRRRRVRGWSPDACSARASLRDARPEFAGWLREQGRSRSNGVDTRTLVRKIRDGGVLRCALGDAPVDELLRAGARRAVHRRPPARPPRRARASRTRSAPGPRVSSSTSARSARSRAGSRRPGSRCTSCRATGTPTRSSSRARASC